jgi:1-acyl-sn-glycerol-3-phosphate acyltransferase
VYALLYPLAWLLAHLFCRFSVQGRKQAPLTGPLLVVSNHLSVYDPILLALALRRRIWFFTKREMFSWPIIGWLTQRTGQIPVRRGEGDRAALEQALGYLREERAVLIFPEGTVARQERMIAAHTGVAMLALRSGATLLPVTLSGSRRIFRRSGGLRPRVTIQIGEPYTPVFPEGTSRKEALHQLTQEIMLRIATLLPPEQRGVYANTDATASNPS